MKISGAVMVALLSVGPVFAQFGNVAFPGFGRAPVRGNPWGNVVFPAIPGGAAAVTGAYRGGGSRGGYGVHYGYGLGSGYGYRHFGRSAIYAYPVYVGGYGYGYGYGDDYGAPPPAAPPESGGTSAPPVIINQYFSTPPPDQAAPPDAGSNSDFQLHKPAADETAPPASDESYYLIAMKDHTIYSAVAFYTEGDTLHYFTPGNVHNQVSLSLVDGPLTEKLNRDRGIDVRLTH